LSLDGGGETLSVVEKVHMLDFLNIRRQSGQWRIRFVNSHSTASTTWCFSPSESNAKVKLNWLKTLSIYLFKQVAYSCRSNSGNTKEHLIRSVAELLEQAFPNEPSN
jgi:hypothetical protein